MNHSEPEDRTEGDYRFMELLGEDDLSRTWLAEQVSVSRTVLVVELRPERMARRGDFLADVRAKAAVDHPLIGPVYEAVAGETRCFYVCEKLHGATLQDHLEAGESLEPLRLAELLRKVSEAQLHHESAGHATLPLEPGHIHLDGHAVVRLRNLAVSGSRDACRRWWRKRGPVPHACSHCFHGCVARASKHRSTGNRSAGPARKSNSSSTPRCLQAPCISQRLETRMAHAAACWRWRPPRPWRLWRLWPC
jgi:hypothetical protein